MKQKIGPIDVSFHPDLGPDGDIKMITISRDDQKIGLTIEQAKALADVIRAKVGQ